MTLRPTDPDENLQILRLISAGGRWELGLAPMLFGVRVRAGLVGDYCVALDYCAGADTRFQMELLAVVIRIFETLPEAISPAELQRMLPQYKVRPINNDPCWGKLQAMEKAMTRRCKIISALVEHARPIILTRFRPDSCIMSARVALDALSYFGIPAAPMTVRAFVANRRLLKRLGKGQFDRRRNGEWSVGIGYGYDPNRIDPENAFDGHLVLISPHVGGETLIDLSLDQAARPQYGIHAKPLAHDMPPGWRENDLCLHFNSWGVMYRPHTPRAFSPAAADYRLSPDWSIPERRTDLVAKTIEAIENQLLHTQAA